MRRTGRVPCEAIVIADLEFWLREEDIRLLLKVLTVTLAVAFANCSFSLLADVKTVGRASSKAFETNRTFPEGANISSAVVPLTITSSDHMEA